MKYKNISKGTLKFRAFDTKGKKVVFEVSPGEEVEVGRELNEDSNYEKVGTGKLKGGEK